MPIPQSKGDEGWFDDLHPFDFDGVTVLCTAAEALDMDHAQGLLDYAREAKADATSLGERLEAELDEQAALAMVAAWWEHRHEAAA